MNRKFIEEWARRRFARLKSRETIELIPLNEDGRIVYQSPPHLRRPRERDIEPEPGKQYCPSIAFDNTPKID